MHAINLPQELQTLLKSQARLIYYVTEEEDVALREIHRALTSNEEKKATVKVYNQVYGLQDASAVFNDWETRSLASDPNTIMPTQAFDAIYKDNVSSRRAFYLITDPHRWMQDPGAIRRILNVLHQVRAEIRIIKSLICIGPRLVLPPQLITYAQVVRDERPSVEAIRRHVDAMHASFSRTYPAPPRESASWFSGLTYHEIEMAMAQSIVLTKPAADEAKKEGRESPSRIDKSIIQQFKRDRIKRTDLLSVVDVSEFTFDKVGGLDKFKAYAERTKASWTAEGRKFGLTPPKGVLAMGIWGCGKSLSVKALGNAWHLPVIQLEMGKLRNSAVGETEANIYRAISYIESMAPALVWVDEAEKSFAGAESSGRSDAGTTARALGILSTWHQETSAEICLCMTANSITGLPVEFTNRMEDRFFFDLPSEDDRVSVLEIQLQAEGHMSPEKIAEFDLRALAKASEDLVPREMVQAIREALRGSFHADAEGMDFDILREELENRPRILKTMDAEVRALLDWVGYDADRDEGVRARMASSRRSKNTMNLILGGSEDEEDESNDDE